MRRLDRRRFLVTCAGGFAAARCARPARADGGRVVWGYEGRHVRGQGDARYLELLDISYRMLLPDPELQNLTMLYAPAWNGFVEGPTWGAWWIQNSYGTSYCAHPFLPEPHGTFLANANDLWFSQMGDGQRKSFRDWVAPDGCLCDAAAPGTIIYKQGDGRVDIHDWAVEFTAAGVVLQSDLLLIGRDPAGLAHYLPLLRRSMEFLDARRDPANNLYLGGPAANLLAPSHAGWKRPDGAYDRSYLTGLSVTTIAALDRMIELERLAGEPKQAARYEERRDLSRQGLAALTTDEGYLIKSLDPDGVRHGVYGAPVHGYFEAVCNHDAVAFRVVDDAQAEAICRKIDEIPGLRPHDLIITNYPSLDDLYTEPTGLWSFGTWVNGGHWTTCEARMILAYYRLGRYGDARRAMEAILALAREFRLDNPLVDFGGAPYQPGLPNNCVYDAWGAPMAMLRGLFEYLYKADRLTLVPHIPPGITRLEQRFPVRFGRKRLFLATEGAGTVRAVWVNGKLWRQHTETEIDLPYDALPAEAHVVVCLGEVERPSRPLKGPQPPVVAAAPGDGWDPEGFIGPETGNGRPLRIGADSNGEHRFVGEMGRVSLWGRALTEAEIAALAADRAVPPPPGTGLVALYDPSALADGLLPNAAGGGLAARVVGEGIEAGADGLRFAGGGYLEVENDARLLLGAAYTLEAWIRPSALPEGGVRILDRVTAGIDDGYLLDTYPSDGLRLITERGVVSEDARLPLGQWTHVAATFDPTAGLALYVNGRQVAAEPAKADGASPAGPGPARLARFVERLRAAGLGGSYEARHAELALSYLPAIAERARRKKAGTLHRLAPRSQEAADRSYIEAAQRLAEGLRQAVEGYAGSEDAHRRRVLEAWRASAEGERPSAGK